ncbi:MAG: 3-hydroxyacyl-ACP dehydratase [Bacteroidetes bacterium]|nr:3-hydroxyacyl-ACP dehydratase [Bacteroidota bacterium]
MASPEEINIPQKPPMVMVDRLIEIVDKTTVTAFLIREDNVFCEHGEFREPGLIENMAQTAAAGVGAKPGNSAGQAPLGFIGGIRNLIITGFPKVGQEIITRVTVMHEVFDATIVQGEVFLDDKLIAGCELKIFLIKN